MKTAKKNKADETVHCLEYLNWKLFTSTLFLPTPHSSIPNKNNLPVLAVLAGFIWFPKWRTIKHEQRNFIHNKGVFEVEKKVFMNKNFHFFTPAYFLIFQEGGKKDKKHFKKLYIKWGFHPDAKK